MFTKTGFKSKTRLYVACCILLYSQEHYAQQRQHQASDQHLESIELIQGSVSIASLFEQIEAQTGYKIAFSSALDPQGTIVIDKKNIGVTELLNKISQATQTQYQINSSLISFKKQAKQQDVQVAVASIGGKVLDENGLGLPGVVVQVKGNSESTFTDIDGNYTIQALKGKDQLEFTFMGYKPKSIVAQSNSITSLEQSYSELDEIIVVGYGTQEKRTLTTAIEKLSVSSEDMRQIASPVELLQGKMAGVSINTSSGNLGTGERVSIRGISSISASNEPLYVVDGIPLYNPSAELFNKGEAMSSLTTLNTNDIESIEVLKDAAAASIYGSRANNGVIIITTKKGKKNSSSVKFNFNTGISEFANKNKIKISNSKMFVSQYNEAADNYNTQYGLTVGDNDYKTHIYNPFGNLPDTNWLDVITQRGSFLNADLSFSGGSDKTIYYIGGTYMQQEGVIKTNSMKKYNLNTKLETQVTPWLTIGTNNNLAYVKNNQVPGPNLGTTIVARAIEQRPFDRPYKPNGEYYIGGTEELTRHNPVQILNEQEAYLDMYRYIGNLYASINFTPELSFKNSLNTDYNYTYDYLYYNEKHPYGTGVGRLVDSKRTITNIETENVLTYSNVFNDFGVTAMLGHSFQKVSNNTTGIDARGFPSASFDVVNVASEIKGATGYVTDYAMESYFSRVNLDYMSKYMLSASIRTDGSSKFAPDTRWGWFPSISVGWNIDREDFMKQLDMGAKVRLSYGSTGNQEGISNYGYQALLSGGNDYGLESGIAVSSFGNSKLTWEKANQVNLGFDLSFFQRRLSLTVDMYKKTTNNLLYSMPIHATSGMSSILTNIGSMQNKGIEISLGTDLDLGAVNWRSNFNIATNKNKITQLIDNNGEPLSIGGNRALQVGKDIGAFYLFVQEGIYQYDGEVPQEQYERGVRAGDVKWRDVDGNNIINDNDRQVIGSSNPKFFGGWNNSFSYKGFQLDILSTFSYGNDVYANWKSTVLGRLGDRMPVLETYYNNRWTHPGSTNKYPRAIMGDTNNNKNSDRWLEDGSFFKIQSVTLGYNFDAKVLEKIHLSGLRVYVQATNLLLLTKYSGWDPSVSPSLDARFYGNDALGVPPTRNVSVGVNVNF
ncbi:SusC/RagA family TonB-linked outer membrane protein [Myroides sp. LoEW2-1]|uniref:SusC/RagA family TonB-linked outer membrane protein n=1 Tax=Myroides sp. LoEW2-1 TaxID=2683192 RepID=UPI0013299538|nr:TonB-dependent receptor [Myroides sp. LoEW2-1]MVX36068.1 SusC/RagA family TonB-linked outer membrane protein [Myroides sp. LoEW2-1]